GVRVVVVVGGDERVWWWCWFWRRRFAGSGFDCGGSMVALVVLVRLDVVVVRLARTW
ncbi:hypothetical protein L195_g062927, partial [Trifolium pratense]